MDNNPSLSNQSNPKPTTFGLPKLREQVINTLEQAYVNNDLDSDDYENRLVLAHSAQSVEELENVIHDFPQKSAIFKPKKKQQGDSPAPYTRQNPTPFQGFIYSLESADSMSLIGDTHISTLDIAKPNVKIIRGIGNSNIDLRDIAHKFSHIRIETYGFIGDVNIRVPMNAQVKKRIFMAIGEKTQRIQGKAQSFLNKIFGSKNDAPRFRTAGSSSDVVIEIAGFNLIGNLNIEYCPD